MTQKRKSVVKNCEGDCRGSQAGGGKKKIRKDVD